MRPTETNLSIPSAQAGQRLDVAMANMVPDLSRSELKMLISEGKVHLNDHNVKPSTKVAEGDIVSIAIPPRQASSVPVAEDIPLSVVYENSDVVVLDKSAGMVVHPSAGHESGTLVNALLARYPELGNSEEQRPGIVHRLDKDTSGLMLVARNKRALWYLQDELRKRRAHKEYTLLCCGTLRPPSGTIEAPIGRSPANRLKMAVVSTGREAWTGYETLETLGRFTLARAALHTGRTHQIRVHFASVGHPLAGDTLYGNCRVEGLKRQFLHSSRLVVRLPNGEQMEWTSPLPSDLQCVLDKLHGL